MENFDWNGVVGALLMLIALGFGTNRGVEVLKALTRLIGAKWDWAGITGYLSYISAFAVALGGLFFFDFNPFDYIDGLGFEYMDADLAKFLASMISVFIGNKIHDNGK